MKAALVALLLATGGPEDRQILQVSMGAVTDVDGKWYEIHGGLYLPPEASILVAKEMATLRKQNEELAKAKYPTTLQIVLPIIIAVVAGGAAGFVIAKL